MAKQNKSTIITLATTAILLTLVLIALRSDFRFQTTFTFGFKIDPQRIIVEPVPETLKIEFYPALEGDT